MAETKPRGPAQPIGKQAGSGQPKSATEQADKDARKPRSGGRDMPGAEGPLGAGAEEDTYD